MSEDSQSQRSMKKNLLLSYYTQNNSNEYSESSGDANKNVSSSSMAANSSFNSSDFSSVTANPEFSSSRNPYDINSVNFDPDTFFKRLIKEKKIEEIVDIEDQFSQETRTLDSEMQTLVSENYNKFISATDTIRKMRNDFKIMEEEMENLVVNMGEITEFNDSINSTFKDKRTEILRLSGIDSLLKKLQFIFDLPSKLNEFITVHYSYSLAIKYYLKARNTLEHYKHMSTFKSIEDDCATIINNLKTILYSRLDSVDSTSEEICESVNFLYQLEEPIDRLCSKYITHVERCLDKDLEILENNIDLIVSSDATQNAKLATDSRFSNISNRIAMDILEFVDNGCNNFLANLSSIIQSYNKIFIENQHFHIDNEFRNEVASVNLNNLVTVYWHKFCLVIKKRFEIEQSLGENTIIVKAVDRFYRKIQIINKQIPNIDLSIESSNIALYAAMLRVNFYLQVLKEHFNECLIDLRHNVALLANNTTISDVNNANSFISTNKLPNMITNERKLQSLHDATFKSIMEQIKNVLINLQSFIASDISFSAKVHFNEPFCKKYVRESLLIPYLQHIAQKTAEFANGSHDPVPYPLLLILSKLCLEFESVAIDYLITLVDEQFFISNKNGVTNKRELSNSFKNSAKILINYYVKVRGLNISQMIRKSVETRDWLNTVEPRNVRSVMKRIVEDFTSIDLQVGELFEPGQRKDKGSDSSRNTFSRSNHSKAVWSYTPNTADTKLLNNINKLFAEKIEMFVEVEFTKVSVLTGIVKITFKTLLECIRLKTFSKYGLQQIQVDCHYLQLYLWRFASDESLVNVLLEEVLTSSIHRCTEPELMDVRVIELICEN